MQIFVKCYQPLRHARNPFRSVFLKFEMEFSIEFIRIWNRKLQSICSFRTNQHMLPRERDHLNNEIISRKNFFFYYFRMVHVIAMEVLPEERDRKYYADNYSCCPPPLFVIFVTLVEVSTKQKNVMQFIIFIAETHSFIK